NIAYLCLMETFLDYILQVGNLNPQQLGLIRSKATVMKLRKDDTRNVLARFSKENRAANQVLVDLVVPIAADKKASPAQIALSWVLAQKPFIAPIPGTSKLHRLQENIGATRVTLTNEELNIINAALATIKIVGERYPAENAKRTTPEKDKEHQTKQDQ